MDVEDWYHLDYLDRSACDASASLLDGLDRYLDIVADAGVPSTFFAVGDVLPQTAARLRLAAAAGHDVGSHGYGHKRPLTLPLAQFVEDLRRARYSMANALGFEPAGYRAPCFSLDRQRLDLVREAGFVYDSSRIEFGQHPLYGTIDMMGFEHVRPWVYRAQDFFEFEVSTLRVRGRDVPVSGGGYIRLLPWWLMSRLLNRYLARETLYVLYIHPFELSQRAGPPLPPDTGLLTRLRFSLGRSQVTARLSSLLRMLRSRGFTFTTFAQLRRRMLDDRTGDSVPLPTP